MDDPQSDYRRIGPLFIDILFGFAASEVFITGLGSHPDKVAATTLSHLGLALAVIALSYIGYHNNRVARLGGWPIRFFNAAFFEFVVDIAIVTAYFMLALIATRGPTGKPGHLVQQSAAPGAIIIAIVLVFYFLFDALDLGIVKATLKEDKVTKTATEKRLADRSPTASSDERAAIDSQLAGITNQVAYYKKLRKSSVISLVNTAAFACLFIVAAAIIVAVNPSSKEWIIGADCILVIMLIAYRFVGAEFKRRRNP